jgi:5-methylcytosine-specific restriction endonuclease McrA
MGLWNPESWFESKRGNSMARGRLRSWTDEELARAVATSTSLTDVIRVLGLRPAGGNHRSVRAHVARLGPSTEHFTHERRTRGIRAWRALTRHSAETALRNGSGVDSAVVRRLARRLLAPYACAICGNPGVHNGLPLTLHLDHVNGVHDDNRLENLRWLCPNCHSQTPTYCGRSSRRRPNRVSERRRPWPPTGSRIVLGAPPHPR